MKSINGVPDMPDLHSGGTIGSLIVNAIARFGDRPAIADGRVRWTYREFGEVVARFITLYPVARSEQRQRAFDPVRNRAESWAAICAALVMGVRYTPLHPMAAEDDHAYIIEDAEIDVLIVEGAKFAPRGLAIGAGGLGVLRRAPAGRRRARDLDRRGLPGEIGEHVLQHLDVLEARLGHRAVRARRGPRRSRSRIVVAIAARDERAP